jgi:hypothetical protein
VIRIGRTVQDETMAVMLMVTSAHPPLSKVILENLNVSQTDIYTVQYSPVQQQAYNYRPMVFLLTKTNSAHMFAQDFYKISLNADLSCTPESSKMSPVFTFPDEKSVQV